jgi:hypothetical protein
MTTKTTVHIEPIFKMLSDVTIAREAAADELVQLADPYVPFLSGDTAGSVQVHSSRMQTYIEYPLDYANYIYQGQAMAGRKPKHPTGEPLVYGKAQHPLAGPQWDQRALNDHPGALEKVVLGALLLGS